MRRIAVCAALFFLSLALPVRAFEAGTPAFAAPSVAQSMEIKAISAKEIVDLAAANKGKIVFVNFFATWCPPCREEIPDLIALRKMYPEDKVLLIGVSLDDDSRKLQQFVRQMGFTYPVYRATDGVGEQFSITSIPHNLVFAKDGKVVVNQPGMVTKAELAPFFDQLLKL